MAGWPTPDESEVGSRLWQLRSRRRPGERVGQAPISSSITASRLGFWRRFGEFDTIARRLTPASPHPICVSKQSLLLVDGDTRSLRVLEVSLRKAGFMVTAATSVQDALDKLELHAPDLIISETTFPDGDGFELRRRVRATPEWSEIPFIFLTAQAAIENKIRGLELGVDDYLTKPIYIKEIVTRINILLQKRQRVRFEERRDGRTRFAGRVGDMPVVDVIQTIEISRKSGVIQFVGERGRQAAIYFRDGRVIDAEAGSLQGEDAVYRLLTWSEGEFEVVFRTVRRREVIAMSSQALLMEGMRRLDEWSRAFEQLPPLTHRFEIDTIELAARLGDVPDDNNRILRLVDGKRTLLEVIDASDSGDLECLQAISRLYFEELLIDLDHGLEPGKAPRRDTGKHVALVEVDGPSAVSEETSGPIAGEAATHASLAAREVAAPSPPGSEDAVAGAEPPEPSAQAAPGAERAAAEDDAEEVEPPGPLMGGYRPSSLRLIDEAVAAAQAIEPTLFDDSRADEPQPEPRHTNGVSRGPTVAPTANGHAAEAEPGHGGRNGAEPPAGPRPERDDSGLRMIGSLGRDRAEASGELAPLGQARPIRSETARELVTILPRRITRELPVLPQDLAESLPTPTPTAAVLIARPTPAVEVGGSPAEPTLRVTLPGSGVTAASRSRRLLRMVRPVEGGGPGLVAMLLIVVALVLAATAGLLRLRRHPPSPGTPPAEGVHDAPATAGDRVPGGVSPETPVEPSNGPSAASPTEPSRGQSPGGDPAEGSSAVPRPRSEGAGGGDGRTGAPAGTESAPAETARGGGEVRSADAGRGGGSGGPSVAERGSAAGRTGSGHDDTRPPGRSASERVAEAKALCDQASSALDEGDFPRGLQLASASIKLHKTAKGYMLRARAEQRLGRVDDALKSLDAAAETSPSYGAVWEQRGRILWAARRRDEARAAFSRFLELSPKASSAPEIERLLNEPR
jgi:CheY-like chemotaxis protein